MGFLPQKIYHEINLSSLFYLISRLPVLAGAAGALGATYCSPYISVDGAYHSRPSGETSSTGASRLIAIWFLVLC